MEVKNCYKIQELSNVAEDETVMINGTIKSICQIPTKINPKKFIRFVTLQDITGKIDCVCFHNIIEKFDKYLQPDNKITIKGLLHRNNDRISVIVEKLC